MSERADAVAIGLALGVSLLCALCAWSCTSVGASIFPPHVNLCDPADFDPKCVVGRCSAPDGGP